MLGDARHSELQRLMAIHVMLTDPDDLLLACLTLFLFS